MHLLFRILIPTLFVMWAYDLFHGWPQGEELAEMICVFLFALVIGPCLTVFFIFWAVMEYSKP